jgi:hypothetical protein
MKTKNNSRVIANIRLAMMLNNDEKKKEAKTVKPRNLPNKGKRLSVIALLGTSLLLCQSCGNFYAQMGTAEAIRAHNDLITGAISQAKTPDGQESDHMQLRKIQATTKSWGRLMLEKLTPNKGVK